MTAYLYPTNDDNGTEWFADLLVRWRESQKRYLCFPFKQFRPCTLPAQGVDFWMYMYYRVPATTSMRLKGKVKFRVHVLDWSYSEDLCDSATAYVFPFRDPPKIWFRCDRAEEIATQRGELLTRYDFNHRDGKQLHSAIRSSIAPVVCTDGNIQVVRAYP